ncbi:MAG TPA: contact-dependent growth inhibition system immunity protein [Pseudomonadales bacterium]|nr:contact-dependent growth inhibition system immunity protein [Pseudomonadales bacterium]
MTNNNYPSLADFIASWFHQDFDLEGETVAEVVTSFLAVTPPEERAALRDDIDAFLAEHSSNLDDDFNAIFQPDIIPSALSGSTRNFLDEIRRLITT